MNNQAVQNAEASAPALAELVAQEQTQGEVPLSMLLDLPLSATIELGRTQLSVQELLRLGRGSVIRLERLAGEPVDIYVADRRFAEGEVLVINEHFGIRITRIVAPMSGESAA